MRGSTAARVERGQGSSVDVAGAYLLLGERDSALRWLERAFHARDMQMTMLHLQPRFSALHGDPVFEALIRRVGPAPRP